jgi:hypothetical protein
VLASLVHFTPGARTAWHGHPLGQSLYVAERIVVRGHSDTMTNIRIFIGDHTGQAELANNPTAADLTSQLPLTLIFRDFNQVEKVAELPQKLTMDGVPPGAEPRIDDIGYYEPTHSLVLYYGEVGYWNGIVRIGRLDPDDTALIRQQPDGFQVTIERATQ